jgi:Zn-dependent protease with chaperone function
MSEASILDTGAGVFFDGRTSARHPVRVTLRPERLEVENTEGRLLAEWPYGEIERLNAPENVLRLGRRGNALLERLLVNDPALAAALGERAIRLDRSGRIGRRQRLAVGGAGVLAMLSLVLLAWIAVPALAAHLTPFVPLSLERRLGTAIDLQVRATLDSQKRGTQFECGLAPDKLPAKLALDRLLQRLQIAAALDIPLRIAVLRRSEANAIALPGGQIYVFQGLIERADTADQLAGVLAHEIGHVANRDGTRAVLQGAGLSFLFGMMLGDFVGGGAVVIAARTLLQSSYSRDTEAAADAYGVRLMRKAGGDGRALAAMLDKIGGATEPGMRILRDHPDTKARIAAIERLAPARGGSMLLTAQDWTALRAICRD